MSAEHLEILVEEPSMEAFLRALLPRWLGEEFSYAVYSYQGRSDLFAKLPARLRGYAHWLPPTWRIVVIIDRDDDDCGILKRRMDEIAAISGLVTRTARPAGEWQVVNRIAIEELEAWYFGDWDAVRQRYPRVSDAIPRQGRYRNPDAVAGGTWEALERVLQRGGYFRGGLRKVELAREFGSCCDPDRNHSHSFAVFRDAVLEACS